MERNFNNKQLAFNKFDKKTPFQKACEAAEVYLNRPFIDATGDGKNITKIKDIIVTLPDCAVYLNTNEEDLVDHAVRNELQIVVLMKNGKKMNEVEEDPEFEAKQKSHFDSLKKRAKKVGLDENASEEEILDAEKAKKK